MKRMVRSISLIVAVVLLVTFSMVGCAKDNNNEQNNEQNNQNKNVSSQDNKDDKANKDNEAKINETNSNNSEEEEIVLEEVDLIGYLLGAAPVGMEKVMEELNKKLKEDINATMTINHIGWGDFKSKYPLILAAGEDIDWIYSADWAMYGQEAAKGAFYELSEDLIKEYMPLKYENMNPIGWEQATLEDGKFYMIPTTSPGRKISVAVIRGDIREKYGLDKIEYFSDIEPYLEAVKENETSLYPMYLNNSRDITYVYESLTREKYVGWFECLSTTGAGSGVYWNLEDFSGKLATVYEDPHIGPHMESAKTIKDWNNKGYINQDVFANEVRSSDSFIQGKSAVGFGNSTDMQSVISQTDEKGWNPEIIPLLNKQRHYMADPHVNNGVAIAATSKNPERAMMALDLIMEDKDYNYLVYFGIEGENYVITEDNKIGLPEGVTSETNTYPPDKAGFWFTNKYQHLPLATWTDDYAALKKDIDDKGYLVAHPIKTMAFDTSNIKTEVANLNQVVIQYLQPLYVGMVDDVEEAYENVEKKLKAAGIEKVKEELQRQVDERLGN